MLTVDVRGYHPASEDTGSYLQFKPPATSTSNSASSDYMAMPGVLKAGVTEAGACCSETDRSGKHSLSSHTAPLSSSVGSHDRDYMEMAAHSVHDSRLCSEAGGRKASDAPPKKLSIGSRGGDDYMSMQPHSEAGYVDMKTTAIRSAGTP